MNSAMFQDLSDYMKVFCFVGLSPKVSIDGAIKSTRIRTVIFISAFLILDVVCAIIVNSPSTGNKPVETLMSNLFVLADVLKVAGIFVQSFTRRRHLASAQTTLHKIRMLLANTENWNVDHKPFRKSLRNKAIVLLLVYILNVGLFVMRSLQIKRGFWHSLVFKCWHFGSICATVHMIFYIDLLRFYLQQLKLSARKKNGLGGYATGAEHMKTRMKNFKLIYYELWEVSVDINASFGWTIVSI